MSDYKILVFIGLGVVVALLEKKHIINKEFSGFVYPILLVFYFAADDIISNPQHWSNTFDIVKQVFLWLYLIMLLILPRIPISKKIKRLLWILFWVYLIWSLFHSG